MCLVVVARNCWNLSRFRVSCQGTFFCKEWVGNAAADWGLLLLVSFKTTKASTSLHWTVIFDFYSSFFSILAACLTVMMYSSDQFCSIDHCKKKKKMYLQLNCSLKRQWLEVPNLGLNPTGGGIQLTTMLHCTELFIINLPSSRYKPDK